MLEKKIENSGNIMLKKPEMSGQDESRYFKIQEHTCYRKLKTVFFTQL